MMKKGDLFLPHQGILPDLFYGLSLIDHGEPVLFTCTDASGKSYLAAAHMGPSPSWLVREVPSKTLAKLICGMISAREVFLAKGPALYLIQQLDQDTLSIAPLKRDMAIAMVEADAFLN